MTGTNYSSWKLIMTEITPENVFENLFPDIDLSDYKPYPGQREILTTVKLRPQHAVMLQKAFKEGTEHISGYFAWAEDSKGWSTKRVLFWIQSLLREEWPCEHYLFLLGENVAGMGSIRPMGHVRHVQMSYWVNKRYLKQRVGETIARTLERLCFESRAYELIYINHDSSNRASGRIPQALGYKYMGHFEDVKHAKSETGLWLSWAKSNPRYEDCYNERLKDLRYVQLFCALMQKMYPETYRTMYEESHLAANKAFDEEFKNGRTISEPHDAA